MLRILLCFLAGVNLAQVATSQTFVTRPEDDILAFGPWISGVTSTTAEVIVRLGTPRLGTLEISTDKNFNRLERVASEAAPTGTDQGISRYLLRRLNPDTQYYFRLRTTERIYYERDGRFRTLPREGRPTSFSFAFASCAESGSQHSVFAEIAYRNPLFFLHLGDLHYENIAENDGSAFRSAYRATLGSPTQSEMFAKIPVTYLWDDHDFGPNDSNRLSPSREAAHAIYREIVPHYPFVAAQNPQGPICQAFTVGRATFILLDTRSQRDPADKLDDANKTMLGAWQKAWFKQQLLAAKATSPLIFIASPVSWISDDTEKHDNWGRYATERRELANFMVENEITGVCFLSGDAHMLAADDGSHDTYADNGGPGFPALQAAPLDRPGSIKGGPWSVEPVLPGPGEGFFGWVEVQDNGGSQIAVSFKGLNHASREKLRFDFTVPSGR